MKKIIIQFIIIFLGVINAHAQYNSSITVSTPNGNPVTAKIFTGKDYTSNEKNDLKNYWLSQYNRRITFESDATYTYNCHAYAWSENTSIWIDQPNQSNYWNDLSYVELTNPSSATKVSYGTADDHSAITTNTPNYFSSKWGSSPRFTHHYNDAPYLPTDLHYYSFPYVIGPTTVCSSNSTFFVNNTLSSSYSVSWTSSGNLNITSTNFNTATVTAVSGSTGRSAWVRATITKSGKSTIVQQNNITPNFPEQANPETLNIARFQTLRIDPSRSYYPDATDYAWEWIYPNNNPAGASLNVYNYYAIVSFNNTGVYTLFAKAKNACGTSIGPTFVYNIVVN